MNPFLALQGFFALPYLLLGLALPFVWFDTTSRSHVQDLHDANVGLLALGAIWLAAFAGARMLVRAGVGTDVTRQSDWKMFFPVTVRLFALAAPVAFVLGFGVGLGLYYTS